MNLQQHFDSLTLQIVAQYGPRTPSPPSDTGTNNSMSPHCHLTATSPSLFTHHPHHPHHQLSSRGSIIPHHLHHLHHHPTPSLHSPAKNAFSTVKPPFCRSASPEMHAVLFVKPTVTSLLAPPNLSNVLLKTAFKPHTTFPSQQWGHPICPIFRIFRQCRKHKAPE